MSNNVLSDYTKSGLGRIKPMVDGLVEYSSQTGRRYIENAIVAAIPRTIDSPGAAPDVISESILQEMVIYLQERDIVPEFQVHHLQAMAQIDDWLIRPGILRKPHLLNLLLGFHGPHSVAPTSPDPWGHIYLMTLMQMVPPHTVLGATVGGHNWLPITAEAIILGVDCIRVGMEDTIWMYPHKDDRIKSCAEVIGKVATIARELGREIATPAEARKIMGLAK
jgi:3-keto-5-aminohexanoate cleavage enzyme